MVDFTVAIPTYNGEHRLPDVLERLRAQIDTEHFSWEIIIVDNNSIDNTAKVVRDYQANWPPAYPLKYCFAPEQGAAFARQRAVEKARGKLIGFLDDDNLPALNWVAAAYSFAKEHPETGAYGSQIHGYFFEQQPEEKLPQNFHKIACFLAIVERGDKAYKYEPRNRILPPGAGLVVRKEVWEKTVPKRLVLNHKGKEAGLASEDLEALLHIQQAGWEIWYNPAMVIHHKIPNSRLQKEYLRFLVRCVGLSRHRLRMMTLYSWQRPLAFPAYMANDLRRLVLHLIKQGITARKDTVTVCERELLSSSLQSPFFLWRQQYLDARKRRRDRQQFADAQTWLAQITTAFEEDRFRLHSQKIRSLGEPASVLDNAEILLRIADKSGKLLLPGQFLPIAERYNLIRTIDRWVIRQLFTQISQAQVDNNFLYELNLSAASIHDDQFIAFLEQTLSSYSISPQRVCFSLSEPVVIAHFKQLVQLIRDLKNIGCQLTLDRVGRDKNYSEYLAQIPVDFCKIDRHLINNLANKNQSFQVEAINQQARQIGIKTIAEYVETQSTLAKIQQIGLNYAQGFGIEPITPLI